MNPISATILKQREFFDSQATKPIDYRLDALARLDQALRAEEKALYEAFAEDLHKSAVEVYGTELGIVLTEIRHHRRMLGKWASPKRVGASLLHFKSTSHIYYEPFGVALIIAPWNYPLHLLLMPLVGALSAGNCATLKPSPFVPHVNAVLRRIMAESFDARLVSFFEGHREVNQALLAERFDYIFCTGSPELGKAVMQAAAKNLTPTTLELGGKSPCIVDKDADIPLAARRILWGKLLNAGQTCIAPDYVLAHTSIKEPLIAAFERTAREFFGADPQASEDYPRIINHKNFDKLVRMMRDGAVRFGGQTDREARYIAPTVIDGVRPDALIMQEEIFGPLLPVLTFDDLDEVFRFVNGRPKPLALYYFGEDRDRQELVLSRTTSGGGCINDTMMQVGNPNLPFGGVGNSGMGVYHGWYSFATFSNQRAIIKKSTAIDPKARYAPFRGKLAFVKALLR